MCSGDGNVLTSNCTQCSAVKTLPMTRNKASLLFLKFRPNVTLSISFMDIEIISNMERL